MAKSLIKSYKGFPDWFKEKNYSISNSASSWADELKFRYFIRQICSRPTNPDISIEKYLEVSAPYPGAMFDYDEEANPIQELTPFEIAFLFSFLKCKEFDLLINTINSFPDYYKAYILEPIAESISKSSGEKVNVSDLEIGEDQKRILIEKGLLNLLDWGFFDKVDERFYNIFENHFVRNFYTSHPLYEGTDVLNGTPVTIDLNFDDKTILNSVETWLKEQRERTGSKSSKPYTVNDFEKWEKYRILQVFDLDTWCTATGQQITDAAISKTLWPDNSEDAEDISPIDRLRKVSRPKIETLIKLETISHLRALAALDAKD